jgi:hypothetical protein
MMAVATLATSMVLMGGAAFASSATTGLAPQPIGEAVEGARGTAADVLNQIDRAF